MHMYVYKKANIVLNKRLYPLIHSEKCLIISCNAESPELEILTQENNKESYELAGMQDCTLYNISLSRLHLGIGSTRTRATEPEGCEKGTIPRARLAFGFWLLL